MKVKIEFDDGSGGVYRVAETSLVELYESLAKSTASFLKANWGGTPVLINTSHIIAITEAEE